MYDGPAQTMSRDERAVLQEKRLRGLVDRLLAVGGVQGRRLREAGVGSGDEVTLADLHRLPAVTKQDLWDHYPWGLLSVPMRDVVAVHGSSGTGGRPTLVAYTRADLELWGRMCARSLSAAGATEDSLVHNAYGYGLFTGGQGLHQGAITLGATVVPMSGGMTARQARMITDLKPDILTCTPSYAIRIGEELRKLGVDPSENGLRAGIFGAEPWSDALRPALEDLLGLKALDIYGLSEVIGPGVATECREAQDGLHVNEDHFVVEVLDPVTGEPVPDGTPGELVFTTPTKEALPLLRYRCGDIASLTREPCACGRTLARISKIIGRRDDMLVIRGVNVYPSEVERVLLATPEIAPDYLLVVDRRTPIPNLYVACEAAGGADAAGVEARLREVLGLRAEVRVLPPGTVPRTEVGKAVRCVTWEAGEPPVAGLG